MKAGKQTFLFNNVYLRNGSAVVGEKEGCGPLKDYFDFILPNDKWDEESFEKAERKMFYEALVLAKNKAGLKNEDIDMILGGDLLNQIISASFGSMKMDVPFFGLYGACSTICESILIASCMVEGGFANNALCCASSHFSSAERQYRFPLEYGSQPTPTSQWTVTGAGCSIVSSQKSDIQIVGGTVGKIIDLGIKDANNMGAAMAPDDVKIRPYPTNEGMVFFYTQIQYLRGFRAFLRILKARKYAKNSRLKGTYYVQSCLQKGGRFFVKLFDSHIWL